MKRKVIQLAGRTLVLSIPQKWCQKFDIKKGDELDIDEQDKKLVIRNMKEIYFDKADLDITGLDMSILRHIASLYKRGVDEINVTFDCEDYVQKVQGAISKEFVGYEVVKQGKNFCTIKNIARGFGEEFDALLRRTFIVVKEMGEEMYKALKKKEFSRLKNIQLIEETNNRFTTILRRAINKDGYKDYKRCAMMYYCLEELENVADELKYICQQFCDEKKNPFSKEAIELFNKSIELFSKFYDLFYKHSNAKAEEIYRLRKRIIDDCYKMFNDNKKSGKELLLVHFIMTFSQRVFCMLAPGLGVVLP